MLKLMRLLIKWTDMCAVQYVQREAALGTASLYGDTENLSQRRSSTAMPAAASAADKAAAAFGVIGLHILFEPHCFKGIHDAAGKVFVDYKNKGVMGRDWTISNVEQHYDFNASMMCTPQNDTFNFENDFTFCNYIHVLYRKENFISLEADAVEGIKGWRFTEGGCTSRALASAGHGGGAGYSFRSHNHVCFCGLDKCPHDDFTGEPKGHKVLRCTQEKSDREQAKTFVDTISAGMPLASKGNVDDSTAGNEALWISIAKGGLEVADAPFKAAGGTGRNGTRTITTNWAYVDIQWIVKIKVDSQGDVHYEHWKQPDGERTVLTKPKILTVAIDWLRIDTLANGKQRFILRASDYQRLIEAV